jgi:methionine synthase reductase
MVELEPLKIKHLILYASQTGNCEAISEDLLASLAEKKIGNFERFEMNEINKKFSLEKTEKQLIVAILILSSTGDGEMPENGEHFYRYLRVISGEEPKIENRLSHIHFTMLGLGDTNYSKFQGNPKFVFGKLKDFGANFFYQRGEADEATSLEAVIEPWLEGLDEALRTKIKEVEELA